MLRNVTHARKGVSLRVHAVAPDGGLAIIICLTVGDGLPKLRIRVRPSRDRRLISNGRDVGRVDVRIVPNIRRHGSQVAALLIIVVKFDLSET